MKNFLIGLIIGIGKVIPGVSGSIIAIRFNVYEKIIEAIIHYFKDIKNNTIYLFSIFSGVIISILLFSKLILYFYTKYHYITLFIFAILILTGIKDIYLKGHVFFITLLSFIIPVLLIRIPITINISYFTMGIIESLSMIIPGVSGTAIFVSLGAYEKMLLLFIDFNLKNLFLFFIGFSISSLIAVSIINYLFKVYKKETYSAILGFLLSSIVLMFI